MITIVLAGLTGYGITHLVVPFIITIARRYGILDHPTSPLKKQRESVPYLGGIAVYLSFLLTIALFLPPHIYDLSFFFVGVTTLLFLGLLDDLMPLHPGVKFLGQCIATFCFIKGGLYLKELFVTDLIVANFGPFGLYGLIFISCLWMLTLMNGFNLVDIMDGLASTIALCAALSFALCALYLEQYTVALLLIAFAGSLAGFLYFNKPPAQIYLGDAGSLCIGGVIATIPFLISWGRYNSLGFFVPVLLLIIPLTEVVQLIIIRTYKGIPFYRGSRDHFVHYLLARGWNNREILCIVMGYSVLLLVCASAILCNMTPLGGRTITLIGIGIFLWLVWLVVVFILNPVRFSKK